MYYIDKAAKTKQKTKTNTQDTHKGGKTETSQCTPKGRVLAKLLDRSFHPR